MRSPSFRENPETARTSRARADRRQHLPRAAVRITIINSERGARLSVKTARVHRRFPFARI